jgi:3-hydroxyisobutyrate dehydrogenase
MNSTSATRVGFIGLGSQGGPMARRIIDAGYPVTLWARPPATLEPFADTSAKTAGSPAELAAASDLVCVCVRDDADTEQVVDAGLGGLAAGGVIAVHSTVHPDTCRRLAERAATGGVRLIDAPVSGGAPAAEAGRLLVMAGGDEEAVEFCRPVFGSYGDPIVPLGPVGAGQHAGHLLRKDVQLIAEVAAAAPAEADRERAATMLAAADAALTLMNVARA